MQTMSLLLSATLLISSSYASFVVPTITTKTPQGDKKCCKLGRDYDFEGEPCIISGDPHFTTFAGGHHDTMGKPMTKNTAGNFQDAFYYVARCKGSTVSDMPFQILATHFHTSTKAVTSVDYLTFELQDGDDLYYVYFSSVFRAFAKAGTSGVSVSYDRTLLKAPSALTTIELGTKTQIGDLFSVLFTVKGTNKLAIDCKLFVSFWDDGELETKQVYVHMKGGSVRSSARAPYPSRKRRAHYVYIKQNAEFKCASCGLCGNFKGSLKKPQESFEKCNGVKMTIKDGSSASKVPEAYDVNGLTYEYNWYNTKCGTKYDVKKTGKTVTTTSCPASKQKVVNRECNKARNIPVVKKCCAKLGAKQCARMISNCKVDACMQSKNSEGSIKSAVRAGFTETIEDLCDIKDVAKAMEPVKKNTKKNPMKRGKDKDCCQLNKGFDFAGTACVVSGDPHYTMFNGGKHDFQGQPMTKTEDGDYKDAFYYVSRCAGKTVNDLPFQILGTHFYGKKAYFTKTSVTLLDYLTFELIDQDGTLYYMYFSSHIRAYAPAATDGVDISYDKTLADAPDALTDIALGTTTKIGDMYSVKFVTNSKTKTATDMTMTVSFWDNNGLESADVFVQMRGTTGSANNDPYTPYADRTRYYQAAYIKLDDEWKCGTCGMCGQFVTSPSKSAQTIQQCDGTWFTVKDGFRNYPAAIDENGWTFEYNYYNDECGIDYNKEKAGNRPQPKCPAWKDKIVKSKCNAVMGLAKVKACCAKIGSTQCKRLKADCYEDACLMSEDNKASIQSQVNGGLVNEITDLCNIKGITKTMKNQNSLPFNDVEFSEFDDDEIDDDEFVGDEDEEFDGDDFDGDDDEDVFDKLPQNDPFDGDFNDDDIINQIFNEPDNVQPIQMPKPSDNNYVLTLTASDLLIIFLVAANIMVLTGVIYCVCNKKKVTPTAKYVSVNVETEDEDVQFVQ